MSDLAVVLTKAGLNKIASATAEKPLKLEKFAVGDGKGSPLTPKEDMTALVNEKYRDFLNSKYAVDNNIVIECVLRANARVTEGFTIRELGIFDDSGTLIAIAKTPESYRPSNKEGIATETIYSVVLKIENTNNISINLKEGLFATQDALTREIANRTTADTNLDTKITNNKTTITDLQTQVKDLITALNKYHERRIGVLFYHGGNNPPEGALLCDGRFVKISDYPKLFNIIGHRFNGGGVDPNNGMFALPDAINRYLRGAGGDKRVGLYEEDAIRSHSHNFAFSGRMWQTSFRNDNKGADGVLSVDSWEWYGSGNDGGWDKAVGTVHINVNQNTAETGAEETRGKGLMALTCIWFE